MIYMPNAEGRRNASLHVGKELELGRRLFWVYVGAVVVSSTFVVLDSSSAMSMPLLGVRRRQCATNPPPVRERIRQSAMRKKKVG